MRMHMNTRVRMPLRMHMHMHAYMHMIGYRKQRWHTPLFGKSLIHK